MVHTYMHTPNLRQKIQLLFTTTNWIGITEFDSMQEAQCNDADMVIYDDRKITLYHSLEIWTIKFLSK